jgi:ATP-dependent DNA helicase RecG
MDVEQVIDATVENVSRTPRTLQITLYAHNLEQNIEGVLFHPKPYMLRQFNVGERSYYYGRINFSAGRIQMVHPVRIASVGEIVSKYKSVLRSDVMAQLVRRYVTVENLTGEGLPRHIAETLVRIHMPSAPQSREFGPETLYALKFAELYDYMKALQKKRRYFKALYSTCGKWKQWADSLPFRLTDEQLQAIEAIETDLKKNVAAKRMVVGDVGSGKTMVILASVLIARPHRSILMAPTTILANQLFEEARKFLPDLKITLINNKTKKVPLDDYDFIIGTHALLYRELPAAALIMVDEQHRFGTAQRNLLEKLVSGRQEVSSGSSLSEKPHFLQFSATPIPRTQAMIDSAHIDVSLIVKTPFKKDIKTQVIHKEDFAALMKHIKNEILQNHQVLLVYPLVEQSEALQYQSIEEARSFWEERFKGVFVTHGKDREKEEVLVRFRDEGSILIATTVVEVGISLPRLSTVVVVGAERLGLSTLHQLRGRVSRTGLKGYCYLFTHQNRSDRLDAFVKTNSGFDIAALDLKFRQSGDLLTGTMQSGKKFRWIDMGEDENVVRDVTAALRTGVVDG